MSTEIVSNVQIAGLRGHCARRPHIPSGSLPSSHATKLRSAGQGIPRDSPGCCRAQSLCPSLLLPGTPSLLPTAPTSLSLAGCPHRPLICMGLAGVGGRIGVSMAFCTPATSGEPGAGNQADTVWDTQPHSGSSKCLQTSISWAAWAPRCLPVQQHLPTAPQSPGALT